MAKQRSEEHAGLPLISPIHSVFVAVLLLLIAICFGFLRGTVGPNYWECWAVSGLVGVSVSLLYWNIHRGVGLAVYFLTLATLAGIWAHVEKDWSQWTVAVTSLALAIAFTRLMLCFDQMLRGTDSSYWIFFTLILSAIGMVVASQVERLGEQHLKGYCPPPHHTLWAPVLSGFITLVAWLFLLRPAIELACEPIIRLQYRIRSVGPGVVQIPMHGPSIVIANHTCWFDPFFLGLLLPRPITPMMTSDFYDLPVAHWLLKRVFRAIRVPEKSLKQDVPDEIREAIAALDRSECVVIFPEGMLRRSEEKPLKRFGRGVWQILAARPATPVFSCWIEGGWLSYCSYFNGPPTKNKRPDFRRRIDVAVPAPIQLDAETLSKHLTTRIALMNAVLESRRLLNLPEVPAFELPKVE